MLRIYRVEGPRGDGAVQGGGLLLHRDGLGEVARAVHVAAPGEEGIPGGGG
jgi:hypothetical protein